ncbi:MAG: glycosyltransferase [Ruminococcaceae bacterium]|nr:glycosyltransferase [Oscillospiraceae bacterium]
MKVLYLINHAGKAGTEKYVLNLVKAYNNTKCECFFAYNEPGLLLTQLEELGIPCLQLEMKHPFDMKAAKKLAAYLEKNQIDVVHAQYPRENYIALLAKKYYKRVKVVFTSHLTIKTNFIWRITNSFMTPKNHKIISVCNHGKELLIGNGVKKDRIEVIFNAMTFNEGSTPSTIREELGIGDEFLIVTLARYHFAKGLPFLVDSIKRLKEIADKPFKLLIVGDGELWDEITAKIQREGLSDTVYQLGFRKDTENILSGADLFVNSASCLEALSFAMLEALSKKLPLVATNVGGNSDIVNEETDCGIIVEYPDTEAFANAINTLMTDKEMYARMSENAKKAILGRFNYDTMLEKTFDTYK